MNYLFKASPVPRLVDEAMENVRRYQTQQKTRIKEAKSYLVCHSSIIRKMINEASYKGLLSVDLNFDSLNKNSMLGNFDFLFTPSELDQLIVCTTEFLESQGLSHCLQTNYIITVSWPNPFSLEDSTKDQSLDQN